MVCGAGVVRGAAMAECRIGSDGKCESTATMAVQRLCARGKEQAGA